MRRENRKKNKISSNTTVYITGGILLVAIAAFVITFIVYSNKLDNDLYSFDSEFLAQYTNTKNNEIVATNEKEIASASSSIGKTVKESEADLNSKDNTVENSITTSTSNNNIKNNTTTSKKINNNSTSVKAKVEEKDPVFEKPIKGEILKEYAKDTLIYSETLKEWTTHLGVDIKAERASVVKSAADGTVKYIKNDPRYGLTIIIEHSNGFETRYCNLLTTEFVSEGEKVKLGQTIGTVGESSMYEIVDECHLHFEILKNSENVNPSEYIKF